MRVPICKSTSLRVEMRLVALDAIPYSTAHSIFKTGIEEYQRGRSQDSSLVDACSLWLYIDTDTLPQMCAKVHTKLVRIVQDIA